MHYLFVDGDGLRNPPANIPLMDTPTEGPEDEGACLNACIPLDATHRLFSLLKASTISGLIRPYITL